MHRALKEEACRCRSLATLAVHVALCTVSACQSQTQTSTDAGKLNTVNNSLRGAEGVPNRWMDCVDVLRVNAIRGYRVANVHRFGESNPSLRTSYRLTALAQSDLSAFCDWEACLLTNGYGHTCWVNDAGWERCRVCDSGADCDGRPPSQADCIAHADDPARSQCHVGLLQECLIQQALRGPADPRVTQTCQLSKQACAGQLPGDLSAQALAAQHETDQVTIQLCGENLNLAAELEPDSSLVTSWRQILSTWDGGLPPGETDASPPEASAFDGDAADASRGDF